MGAEHRKLPRRKVEQLVLMTSDNGSIIGQCVMLDVSAGGARLKLEWRLRGPRAVHALSVEDRRKAEAALRDRLAEGQADRRPLHGR